MRITYIYSNDNNTFLMEKEVIQHNYITVLSKQHYHPHNRHQKERMTEQRLTKKLYIRFFVGTI